MFEKGSQRVQEVIFFIDDTGVTKEMMYTEFEAVLDGVVGLQEFARSTGYCVFAVIKPGLLLESAVFFTVEFDEEGYPPALWNVPFQSLIQKSSKVSFGPFQTKVVSRSACAVEWHRSSMWDPSDDVVMSIVRAVQENRLCLALGEAYQDEQVAAPPGFVNAPAAQFAPPPVSVSPSQHPSHLQHHQQLQGMASPPVPGQSLPELVQEMAEKLASASESKASSRGLDDELRQTLSTLTNDLHAMTKRANEMEKQNTALRTRLAEVKRDRAGEVQALTREYENKIRVKVSESKQALKEKYEQKLKNYEKEYKSRFNSKVSEIKTSSSEKSQALTEKNDQIDDLKTQLRDKKEVIEERDQKLQETTTTLEELKTNFEAAEHKVKQLSDELAGFRKEKLRLMSQGADKFFETLEKSGINFIAYHPGAGHVSVSVSRVAEYLENPRAFASEKVGMSQEAYEYWLSHYETPCCGAPIIGGKTCGQKIQRHDNPRDFSPGISDRCDKHRTGVSAAGRVFSS